MCFTYFVVIHNTPERANDRLNQREKSVRTVKYKVPAQIAEHASCRNKLYRTVMDSKERKRMRDASQKKFRPSGISGQISRLVLVESDLYGSFLEKVGGHWNF